MYRFRYSFALIVLVAILLITSEIYLIDAVPSIFIFGDSLVDVGNNNYIKTKSKANHKPHGIDFGKPTGRFTNGKTIIDIIGQKLGVKEFIPPYLAPTTKGTVVLKGVNYASGSAGILNETGIAFFRLYKLDARKFIMVELSPIGCIPFMRDRNLLRGRSGCHKSANDTALKYNKALKKLVNELRKKLKGSVFVYVHTYTIVNDIIRNHKSLGFENTNDACCHVLGKHGGLMGCPRYAKVCPDRSKYVFWDGFHPSEATYEIVANRILDGGVAQIEPMNVRQLLKAKTY